MPRMIRAAIAAAVIVTLLGACSTKKQSASLSPSATFPDEVTAAQVTGTTVVQQATVGTALTLSDYDKHDVSVTVTSVADGTPLPTGSQPAAGKKYVAVQLTISDPGVHVVSGHPALSSTLVDAQGGRTVASPFAAVEGCPPFADDGFSLNSGSHATGCVVFEVPIGASFKYYEFEPSDGAANAVGVWTLTSS